MIPRFTGEYRFLSNFWPASVTLDGQTYPTVEHAYQAAKTLDDSLRRIIRGLEKPGQAKRAGARVPLRPDWEQAKLWVMEDLVRQKFTRHPGLGEQLLNTHPQTLVEGNTWGDTFWGEDI